MRTRDGTGNLGSVPHTNRQKENDHTMNDIHDGFRRQGLVRPRDGRLLAGVCAGLGRRFGVGPWTARLLFVLLLLVIPGSQLLVYPILWILMPNEEDSLVTATPEAPIQQS